MIRPRLARFALLAGAVSTDHSTNSAQMLRWPALPIEHLQLPPKMNAALRSAAILTLGDACCAAESGRGAPSAFTPELVEAVSQLRQSEVGDVIDWREYWNHRDHTFNQLAATLPEFEILATTAGAARVNRHTFGNAGAMLEAAGITTLRDLIDGMRSGLGEVRGLGKTKLRDLFDRLIRLANDAADGKWPDLLEQPAPANSPAAMARLYPIACSEIRNLPIAVLQLGTKGSHLAGAGLETIGDLADADPEALKNLKAIGSRTLELIRLRLGSLCGARTENGIDWIRFAETGGLALLPRAAVATGEDLLSMLPGFLEDLAGCLRDDGYRDILRNRLTQAPGNQATLEEIARRSNPPVTRERVRQKQDKLLSQLTGALLWDEDGKLDVHFHPSFTHWWRLAAAEFEGVDEIGFEDFVSRLSRVWKVADHQLSLQLPFIVAVVTGEPQMPASFRYGARLHPRLRILAAEARETPIVRFRVGRSGRKLAERGAGTLAHLVQAASEGGLSRPLDETLSMIAEAVREDGTLDWEHYASAAKLPPLPSSPPTDARSFAESFSRTIANLLSSLRPRGRAVRIFLLRTSLPVQERMTLAAVAEELKCHGPTVKREETELLEELHDVLVGRDFADLPVWLDQEWLNYCRNAQHTFRAAHHDYQRFVSGLALRWDESTKVVERAAPGLWAIFSGYPEGRRRRAGSPIAEPPPPEAVRIVLRGFRRVH